MFDVCSFGAYLLLFLFALAEWSLFAWLLHAWWVDCWLICGGYENDE